MNDKRKILCIEINFNEKSKKFEMEMTTYDNETMKSDKEIFNIKYSTVNKISERDFHFKLQNKIKNEFVKKNKKNKP